MESTALENVQRRTYGDIEEILDAVETRFHSFKNFAFLDHPISDHRFLDSDFCSQLFRRSLTDKLAEEWKTAKTRLPHGIFARVCRSRIDVVRVAIVAEKASSFHPGLFFFDLRFPRNYPACPPRLFHNEFGEKPYVQRFHHGGTVDDAVLSGFCSGKAGEFPVIEVLGFLQRRVLPITSGSPILDADVACFGGERVRVPASDEMRAARISVCEAILVMMYYPPEGFEAYVAGYFRTRAHRILMNLKLCVDMEDKEMKQWFFRMVRAFERNGTYCKHHY